MKVFRILICFCVFAIGAPTASAQHRGQSKKTKHHKKAKRKTFKTKKHHQRKTVYSKKKTYKTHSHRNKTYLYFGVRPYRYHHHHYYSHHRHYRHVHTSHCPSSHFVDVKVTVKNTFTPPSLSCPVRTDEVSDGFTQWCETKRGTKHGPYREWRSDGTLLVAGEYAYDTKDSVWLRYHKNGAVHTETEYDEGARVGTTYVWDDDGEVISAVTH